MTQRRLPWLLAMLGALLLVRWLVPNPVEPPDTAEAVLRPADPKRAIAPMAPGLTPGIAPADATVVTMPSVAPRALPAAGLPDFSDATLAGNAFAVRTPPVIVVPPSPPVRVAAVVVAPTPSPLPAPPPPPIPLAPPIQVIGTWDDGIAPGVFVSTPGGTKLARKGTVLIMEYLVTALTPQQLTLQQISSKREVQLNVPRSPGK